MNWPAFVFVLSFLALVYFIRATVCAWKDPEMQRDLARLREQRRRRKEARR